MTPADVAADWLDGLDGPAWLVDARQGTVQRANAQAARWLGQPDAAALVGRRADQLLPTLEDMAFWADPAAPYGPGLNSELELAHPAGGLAQVVRRIAALGEPVQQWLVQLRDISSERQAERQRDTLLAELRATLEATADGILVTDLRGRIRAFNRRFAQLWSLPETALAGRDDQAVFEWMRLNVLDPEAYQQRLGNIQEQLLLSSSDQIPLLDGTLLQRHSQPQWSQGRPIGRVHTFQCLQPRRGPGTRDLPTPADDALTGHPNRTGFLAATTRAIERARQEGRDMALLCVAFDQDALFSMAGGSGTRSMLALDALLRAQVREPHLIARLGGARYGVLLRGAGEAAAEGLARRLCAAAQPDASGDSATPPLAVGVAAYPQAGLDAETLLSQAETAAAVAGLRDDGPGWQLCGYGGMAAGAEEPQRLRRLRDTVAQGQMDASMRLRYLPRVDARSGRVRSVEALLRWQDAERGELQPAQFLPMAQRAGLAGSLDNWVLERALRQAVQWRASGLELCINLNVGAGPLTQPGYARRVAAVLAACQWPAELLELDVTEAALGADPEAALANLDALRQMGVRVLLDDFGSGDSALSLLQRYPFSGVKIDRQLTQALGHAGDEAGLVLALIQLARALHLEVLVEGVETNAQRLALADAGCSGWQGFLFAPPLDARAVARRVHSQSGLPAANDEPALLPRRRPA